MRSSAEPVTSNTSISNTPTSNTSISQKNSTTERSYFFQTNDHIQHEGFIPVDGGKVWYRIKGDAGKTPLVFIHGGPGGSSCSFTHLKALEDVRPVILYDQLGAGKSEHPKDKQLWTLERFTKELAQVINHLSYRKVHLIAHSWGGAVAANYLKNYGTDKIESVIFVGPYLSSNEWTSAARQLRNQLSRESQQILESYDVKGLEHDAIYQKAENEFYQHFLFRHPPATSGDCDDNSWNPGIYETMWGDSEFKVKGNLKNFDSTQSLPKINIPTLFLIGEFDEAPEFSVRKYQQLIAGAQLEVIPDAAHMCMVDQPKLFMQKVNRFLSTVESKQK